MTKSSFGSRKGRRARLGSSPVPNQTRGEKVAVRSGNGAGAPRARDPVCQSNKIDPRSPRAWFALWWSWPARSCRPRARTGQQRPCCCRRGVPRVTPCVQDARLRHSAMIQHAGVRGWVLYDLTQLEEALAAGDAQRARFRVRVAGCIQRNFTRAFGRGCGIDSAVAPSHRDGGGRRVWHQRVQKATDATPE